MFPYILPCGEEGKNSTPSERVEGRDLTHGLSRENVGPIQSHRVVYWQHLRKKDTIWQQTLSAQSELPPVKTLVTSHSYKNELAIFRSYNFVYPAEQVYFMWQNCSNGDDSKSNAYNK